jgi:hypothetical protein
MNEEYLKWLNGSWKYPNGMLPRRLTKEQLAMEYNPMGGRPIASDLDPTGRAGIPMTGQPPARFYVPPPLLDTEPAPKETTASGKDYMPFAVAGGATLGGGAYSWLAANERLKELENRGPDLTAPPSMQEYLNKTRMAAANSRLPNYNRESSRIASNQTGFNRNAANSTTSSGQLLTAMGGGQQVAEKARENLAIRGEEARRNNERMYREGLLTKAQYEANQKKLYQDSLAALYNAKQQAIGNTLTGISQAALLAL